MTSSNEVSAFSVLSYAADGVPSVCANSGDAYFVMEPGIWKVDHYRDC